MNVRFVVAASIVTALAVFAAPRVAAACSCVPPPPPQEAMASSAAVFEGTVTEIRKPQGEGEGNHEVVLQVGRRFKGAEDDTVTVTTASSSAACGYNFEQGGTYLVYAGEAEGQLSVSLCSRTARSEDAAADFTALGGGTAPDPGTTPQPPSEVEPGKRGCGGCTTGTRTDGAAGLLLMLATLALALRRRA